MLQHSSAPLWDIADPRNDRNGCGIAVLANTRRERSLTLRDRARHIITDCFGHREGCGVRGTHDGSGGLFDLPPDFAGWVAEKAQVKIPTRLTDIGIGTVFLSRDKNRRDRAKALVSQAITEIFDGLEVHFGWRDVPTEMHFLGPDEQNALPAIRHLIVVKPDDLDESDFTFEDRLFFLDKRIMQLFRANDLADNKKDPGNTHPAFVTLISHRKILYKMMASGSQLFNLFPDLNDSLFQIFAAVLHNRYATNTFPVPKRAQPGKVIAHNGEFNTLMGNQRGLLASDSIMSKEEPGIWKLVTPIIDADLTDSGQFDGVAALMTRVAHIPVHEVVNLLMQRAHEHDKTLTPEEYAYYEYVAARFTPWAGPALVGFLDTDNEGNEWAGGKVDINGKRPATWAHWDDGTFYLGSEDGVVDLPDSRLVAGSGSDGQLNSGDLVVVRLGDGKVMKNREIVREIASRRDYIELTGTILSCPVIPPTPETACAPVDVEELPLGVRGRIAGLGDEEIRTYLLEPAKTGKQPQASMGSDLVEPGFGIGELPAWWHLKQLFAQVTNPPLDWNLERNFCSLSVYLGAKLSLLAQVKTLQRQLKLDAPIISKEELTWVRENTDCGEIDVTYAVRQGVKGWEQALERMCALADRHVSEERARVLILTDNAPDPKRRISRKRAQVPILLAVAVLNEHLITTGKRRLVSIVVESDEVVDPHAAATLLSFGASAVCPRFALEMLAEPYRNPGTLEQALEQRLGNYLHAMNDAVGKIIAKMGIPRVTAYIGSKLHQILGFDRAFCDKYFGPTPEAYGGDGLKELVERYHTFHTHAMAAMDDPNGILRLFPATYGRLRYHPQGVRRRRGPEQIRLLQEAVRTQNLALLMQYFESVDGLQIGLRDLLEFRWSSRPVPIGEVEPVSAILSRVRTSPISIGSISKPAHEVTAATMNMLRKWLKITDGACSGSGEGGEDPERIVARPNGWDLRSALVQFASALFGVGADYLANADEIEIKMAQGAKPGEGGQLPGQKVSVYIAFLRHTKPGIPLNSPAPIHCIYSIEDLYLLVRALKTINPRARIWVKLVASDGIGTIAVGVRKAGANVWIAGGDGATGSAPQISISHAGGPWELGLVEAEAALHATSLRPSTLIGTDGGLQSPAHAVKAFLLGSDKVGMGTTVLETLGCIDMKDCHLDSCLAGIATQRSELTDAFPGRVEHFAFFLLGWAQGIRTILAKLGVRTVDELIGQKDRYLRAAADALGDAGMRLTLERLLETKAQPAETRRGNQRIEELREERPPFDERFLGNPELQRVLKGQATSATIGPLQVRNTDLIIGGRLAGVIAETFVGKGGLPEGSTININLEGVAGHFLGFCNPRGVNWELTGRANGFVGLSMTGGRIVVRKSAGSKRRYVAGECCFYGASGGTAFLHGRGGKMFGIRNSGAVLVIEGCHDNTGEFMTGGMIVNLEKAGQNILAGASGGLGFFYSADPGFADRCHQESVRVVRLGTADEEELERAVEANLARIGDDDAKLILGNEQLDDLIAMHLRFTGSERAQWLLNHWERERGNFWKLVPRASLNPARTAADEKPSQREPYFYLPEPPEAVMTKLAWMIDPKGPVQVGEVVAV